MRQSRRTNFIIVASLLLIAVVFAVYVTLVMKWIAFPKTPASSLTADAKVAAEAALERARLGYRDQFLDPRAHLRLSEALWKSGRQIDSFYVQYAARQLFSAEEFRQAHADIVVRIGGPAAAVRARLKGLVDPATTVPVYAEVARDYPSTPEGRDSLEQLSVLAMGPEGSDPARLARTALEELYRADPKNPEKLAALAGAAFGRGDDQQAFALAEEALDKNPGHAGAARIQGMLALKSRDHAAALKWLTAAWDRNPDDLYAAAKIAQIYDKARGDAESALPYYLALYRQNPDYIDEQTAENRIRETLDHRREILLKGASVEALGGRFKLSDASLRAQACVRAAAYKDPRWIDALGDLLDDDAEIVRRNADFALYEIAKANPEAVRARRDSWLSSDKPLVRIRALNLFADLDGKNFLPAVLAALHDPVPAVRALAKIMVLDHYYVENPQAARAKARYLAQEKDPDARALLKRFPPTRR